MVYTTHKNGHPIWDGLVEILGEASLKKNGRDVPAASPGLNGYPRCVFWGFQDPSNMGLSENVGLIFPMK